MRLPRTWPVCVIDDEPDEYNRLFKLLNRLGVGFVHVKGDRVSALPRKPFESLRLVFLDMHLGGDSSSANTAAQTANVFSRAVSTNGALILVVVWSKYIAEIDAFRTELYRSRPEYAGRLLFVSLEKPLDSSGITAAKLKKELTATLAPLTSLRLLWGWESLAHQAAISASIELSQQASRRSGGTADLASDAERERILGHLSNVLGGLIGAEAGQSGSTATAPADLLHALSALHVDRIENSLDIDLLNEASKLVGGNGAQSTPAERAAMNSMLVVGAPETQGHVLKPGTMYEVMGTNGITKRLGFPVDDILREFCTKPVAGNQTEFAAWKAACRVVLIEVSPACDYAQRSRRVARLIAGILVPDGVISKAKCQKQGKKDGSLFTLVRFNLRDLAAGTIAPKLLTVSSRLVVTLRLGKTPSFMKPIARLRDPALTDVRNWCSSEASRVGFLFSD